MITLDKLRRKIVELEKLLYQEYNINTNFPGEKLPYLGLSQEILIAKEEDSLVERLDYILNSLEKKFKPFAVKLLKDVDVNGLEVWKKGSILKINSKWNNGRDTYSFIVNHNEVFDLDKSLTERIK